MDTLTIPLETYRDPSANVLSKSPSVLEVYEMQQLQGKPEFEDIWNQDSVIESDGLNGWKSKCCERISRKKLRGGHSKCPDNRPSFHKKVKGGRSAVRAKLLN